MKKSKLTTVISLISVLAIILFVFAGCNSGDNAKKINTGNIAESYKGGVLILKVNPEIAIEYDENGNVVSVTARNEDAKAILEGYADFEGKPCKTVATELVGVIGKAGYFVEEIEGQPRKITIEIETGSGVPDDTFLQGVADEISNCVSENNWKGSINVLEDTDYDGTDYEDTDYDAPVQNKNESASTAGEATPNDGLSDNTVNQGKTDYDDTDYDDTDYDAPAQNTNESASTAGEATPNDGLVDNTVNQGKTDYDNTDYDDTDSNYDVTDYDGTDYGDTDYDDTDYVAPSQNQNTNNDVSPEQDQNANSEASGDATVNKVTENSSNITPKE